MHRQLALLQEPGAPQVCSSSYTRGGESAAGEAPVQFLPQYFKFLAHNPLSVRTKARRCPACGRGTHVRCMGAGG